MFLVYLFIIMDKLLVKKHCRVQDQGVNQRDIVLGLRKYGVCEEKTWPYKHIY